MNIILGIIAFAGAALVLRYIATDLAEKTKRGIGFFDSFDEDNWTQ